MKKALFFSLLLMVSCSVVDQSTSPPRFEITLPAAAKHHLQHKEFHEGERLHSFWYDKAPFPRHVMSGQWQSPDFQTFGVSESYYGEAKNRQWEITIDRGISSKVSAAIAHAKDAYEAKLGWLSGSGPYIMPRFEMQNFTWGKAISFLVQYQNDATTYAPNNGMLMYEVHGVTSDGKFTIKARTGVTHPRLPHVSEAHVYRQGDAASPKSLIRRDAHYRLVEKCAANEFQPSLDEVDRMIDSIQNLH